MRQNTVVTCFFFAYDTTAWRQLSLGIAPYLLSDTLYAFGRCVSCPPSHEQPMNRELLTISQTTLLGLSGGTLREDEGKKKNNKKNKLRPTKANYSPLSHVPWRFFFFSSFSDFILHLIHNPSLCHD